MPRITICLTLALKVIEYFSLVELKLHKYQIIYKLPKYCLLAITHRYSMSEATLATTHLNLLKQNLEAHNLV